MGNVSNDNTKYMVWRLLVDGSAVAERMENVTLGVTFNEPQIISILGPLVDRRLHIRSTSSLCA